MDGFSYIDIFATKGVEYIIVLGFLLAFFLFLKFVNLPARRTAAAVEPLRRISGDDIAVADGLFYAPGHSYAALNANGYLNFGIDDFLRRAVGSVDSLELPRLGTVVKKGEPLFSVFKGDRKLTVSSPVSGTVESLNPSVLNNPSFATRRSHNWIVSVKPDDLSTELPRLTIGQRAREWMSGEIGRLRDFLAAASPQPSLAGQSLLDGGLPVEGALEFLDEKEWQRFSEEFMSIK